MGFGNQYLALLKKNMILWYRYLGGSLCEILFPLVVMLLIAISRWTTTNEQIAERSYFGNSDAIYFSDNQARSLTGVNPSGTDMGLTPAQSFQSCLKFNRLVIGMVGDQTSALYTGLSNRLLGASGYFTPLSGTSYQFSLKHFSSEGEMEDYVKGRDYEKANNPGLCVGIVIPTQGYAFSLRYDDNNYEVTGLNTKQQIPSTRKKVTDALERTPDKSSFKMYETSGFLQLQYLITKTVLALEGQTTTQLTVGLVPMKTPGYLEDPFLEGASREMSFIIVLCYLAPIFRIISFVVGEKESKSREGMKIMGLKDSAYWLSFLTYYVIINIIIALILTGVSMGIFYKYSNWLITFLFYFLYGMAVFSFAMLVSAFFTRARAASLTGTMLYFASFILNMVVDDSSTSEAAKNAASLLPTLAADFGCKNYLRYESNQYGVNFSNAGDLIENYSFAQCLMWLSIDFGLYFILALYFDNVLPSATGTRKSLWFFLTKEYWTGESDKGTSNSVEENEEKILYPNKNFKPYEGTSTSNKEALKIRHLEKLFGLKQAVIDFSVDMYSGEIFALLGPNGAGKTTTLSMLTGLVPVTGGEAKFNEISVFQEMDKMREKLGVCTQHDVLFERLTPREHLEMFASFKGRSGSEEISLSIDSILKDVDLLDSENNYACNLSGGQKRKLSIAIAFIGDSPIIFLDEPTSGMDMQARHKVWDILKKYKKDKVIILTTHFMEEAEVLGDRIGIMTHGALKCCGPPLFLKKRFNIGYNVTMVKAEKADSQHIQAFVLHYFPNAKLSREASKEMTFHIPKPEVSGQDNFRSFFSQLDQSLEELQIESYGMASSTLEEIFIKVAKGEGLDDEEEKGDHLIEVNRAESVILSGNFSRSEGYSLVDTPEDGACTVFLEHLCAILLKRLLVTARNWTTLLMEIVVPAAFIMLGFCLTLISFFRDGNARWFGVNTYPTPQRIYLNENQITGDSVNTFISTFHTEMEAIKLTVPSADPFTNLKYMDEVIYSHRGDSPTRYGSAYVSTLDKASQIYKLAVFGNMESQDVAAVYMGVMLESVLRHATSNNNLKLSFANHPLPLNYETRNLNNAQNGGFVAVCIVIAFALIPTSIISYIVKEREDNLKHQQFISGVSMTSYWLSNSFIDVCKCIIPACLAIGMLYAFDVDLGDSWILILLYALSIIPFTYASSFAFQKENLAQVSTLMGHFFIGVIMPEIITMFRLYDSTRDLGKGLAWVLRIIPSFSLSNGIQNIAGKVRYTSVEGASELPSDFSFDCSGGDLLFLSLAIPLYILIIMFIEMNLFYCIVKCFEPTLENSAHSNEVKPADVQQEIDFIEQCSQTHPPAILAKHLRKVYRLNLGEHLVAVSDVSFYTEKGECFALLGTNGAGKTTTFKMLTQDVVPTEGTIRINGLDLSANFQTLRKQIGYCPQYDASFFELTVRENLEFYAKVKGLDRSLREELVQRLMIEMQLQQFEHVLSGNLSGGNKRKLSVAIAILGNPPIILLDEASTGVDPQAKRFMWKVIQRITTTKKRTAVVLTTHSMEEAEALCTKMAIMVNGNFRCIGTPQQLKDNFGKGFEIQLNISIPTEKEINYLCESLKMDPHSEISLGEAQQFLSALHRTDLIGEINANGYACDFYREFSRGKKILLHNLACFFLIEQEGRKVALELCEDFNKVSVPEHYNNFYKFRVEKQAVHHTIGHVFGVLQDLSKRYTISEYSCSQTTLNQIFHSMVQQAESGVAVVSEDRVICKEQDELTSKVEIRINSQNSGSKVHPEKDSCKDLNIVHKK